MQPTTPAERRLLAALTRADPADFTEGTFIVSPKLPGEDDETLRLRPCFVQWLATAGPGAPRLPPTGLLVRGALIHQPGAPGLSLEGCTLAQDLGLVACRFRAAPVLRGARLRSLFLNASHLPGIVGDRLRAEGSVFLRNATVEGEARFLGARIGGSLDCSDAKIRRSDAKALSADGVQVEGDVFLRNATVEGEARFPGARIGGDLDCTDAKLRRPDAFALNADGVQVEGSVFLGNATVEGEVCFVGARIGGAFGVERSSFVRPGNDALALHNAIVKGGLFLRQDTRVDGRLGLSGASVGSLADEPACWPAPGNLDLARFDYGAFLGKGVSAAERIRWLGLQQDVKRGFDFSPQPWEQCAKVLREMGHASDARAVLVDKEQQLRAHRRQERRIDLAAARLRRRIDTARPPRSDRIAAQARIFLASLHTEQRYFADRLRDAVTPERLQFPTLTGAIQREERHAATQAARQAHLPWLGARSRTAGLWWSLLGRRVWDHVLGIAVGYGYQPQRALFWALGFWLTGALVFAMVDGRDGMMPNNAFIIRAPEWVRCTHPAGQPIELSQPARLSEPVFGGRPATGVLTTGLQRPGERSVDCFHRQPEGADYPYFEPLSYAADTFLPIVDLHQQEYWTPNRDTWEGWTGRGYLWLHILLGWALSLLAVAGFSGIVKSD
ncbi:MAG: hypothetical protein AAF677_13920 [Pseudomonadota bacterium]